jgi:dihydrofolate reductase
MGLSVGHLLQRDVVDAVRRLEDDCENDVLMYSSTTLMHSLLGDGLIDRFLIWVHPLIVGSGRRLFADGVAETGLELRQTTSLPNGLTVLGYERRP